MNYGCKAIHELRLQNHEIGFVIFIKPKLIFHFYLFFLKFNYIFTGSVSELDKKQTISSFTFC